MSAVMQQINLYNPALRPARESFSARQLLAWVVIAALAMGALGWWATRQARELKGEIAGQPGAGAPTADAGASPQQVAAMEKALRERQALLAARLAARDGLKRGMAASGHGPSGLMGAIARTLPAAAWITELRVAGSRIEAGGRTLDPGAVEGWLQRLRADGFLAEGDTPAVRVERMEAAAIPGARGQATYSFHVTGTLAFPFADDGTRP